MSDSYSLGCNDCKKKMTIGQSSNSAPPFCFYSGEPETMKELRQFFYDHFRHKLVVEFSDVLADIYDPSENS